MSKSKCRSDTDAFKRDAVKLVTERGYLPAEAARNLGVHAYISSASAKLDADSAELEAEDRTGL